MPSPPRGALRRRLLLLLLAAGAFAAVFSTRVSQAMPGVEMYWAAGSRAAAGTPIYRLDADVPRFTLLPAFAVAARPLARLPLATAKAVWFGASAVLVVALLWTSLLALPGRRLPAPALAVLTFVAMAKFYAHELLAGQVHLLVAAIAMTAVLQLRRGRDVAAGLLLAATLVVEPYAALFAPWLMSRGSRTALGAMMAGAAVVLFAPAALYGWTGNLAVLGHWWRAYAGSIPVSLADPDNISIAALAKNWLGGGPPTQIVAITVSLAALSIAVVAIIARPAVREPEYLEAAIVLILIPLLSPHGRDYWLLVATPAAMVLIDRVRGLPPGWRLASIAAVAVLGLSLKAWMGAGLTAAFMTLSLTTVCALVELAALLALRLRRMG